jgi:hypothetical protein
MMSIAFAVFKRCPLPSPEATTATCSMVAQLVDGSFAMFHFASLYYAMTFDPCTERLCCVHPHNSHCFPRHTRHFSSAASIRGASWLRPYTPHLSSTLSST